MFVAVVAAAASSRDSSFFDSFCVVPRSFMSVRTSLSCTFKRPCHYSSLA